MLHGDGGSKFCEFDYISSCPTYSVQLSCSLPIFSQFVIFQDLESHGSFRDTRRSFNSRRQGARPNDCFSALHGNRFLPDHPTSLGAKRSSSARWDDYIITAAMALIVIEAALTIQALTHGKGKRAKFLSKAKIQYINTCSWYAQHVMFAAMALIKTSVCLLVVRIKPERELKIFVGVVIAVLVTASVEVSIVLQAQCRPISAHCEEHNPGSAGQQRCAYTRYTYKLVSTTCASLHFDFDTKF